MQGRMIPSSQGQSKIYHQHMVTVLPARSSNYEIQCSCGHVGYIASLSDVFAAESALRHVQEAQEAWDQDREQDF